MKKTNRMPKVKILTNVRHTCNKLLNSMCVSGLEHVFWSNNHGDDDDNFDIIFLFLHKNRRSISHLIRMFINH